MQDATPDPETEQQPAAAPPDRGPVFQEWGTWALSLAVAGVIAMGLWSALTADRVGELRYPEQVATRVMLRPVEALIGLERASARAAPEGPAAEPAEGPADADAGSADAERAESATEPEPPAERDAASATDLASGRIELARGAALELVRAAQELEESAARRAAALADAAAEWGPPPEDEGPWAGPSPDEQVEAALRLRVRAAAVRAELGDAEWRTALAGTPIVEHVLLDALEAAFGDGEPLPEQADAARALGEDPGALALRLALKEAAGDTDGVFELTALGERRAVERFESLVELAGRLAPFLFAGLGLLAASFFLPREVARVGQLPSPAGTFSTADAWAVFVRYFVLFQIIGAGLVLSLGANLAGYETLLASLPIVGLVQLVAVRREAQLGDLLGIDVDTTRPLRFVPVTLVAWVVCVALVLGLAPLVARLSGSGAWANPLLDALVDPEHDRSGLFRGAVLWAPIFEELAFRGVLYAGLRARFGVLRAAVLSSLVFGFAHSYDLGGNLAIAGVGFVLALTYERSRSLLPCIFAHALFNYGQIAYMLRMYG